ncbi:CU044_2847 family protein [Streptomyces sp. NPDC020996]|uniref:CU044_2847 family protein n=1 Tax=Streptomyces sp. NPDC020996 TaxID=3154791 RepID=UPI0033F3BB59
MPDSLVEAAGPGRVAARAARSLNDRPAGIRPVAQNSVSTFRDMPDGPGETGTEVGLALSADAGTVISRTAGQAGLTGIPARCRPADRAVE